MTAHLVTRAHGGANRIAQVFPQNGEARRGQKAPQRTEEIATELFELMTQVLLSTMRGRRKSGDLKEVEFLALNILKANGTMIVGDLQRLLSILPAQMSRVIRSLENRERPLIQCRINPRDKRKIDVHLTPHGEEALQHYEGTRANRIAQRLGTVPEEDQEEILGSLHKLLGVLRN